MAQPATKPKIEKDRYAEDGVRLFNPTKPHGVVYADGFMEAKYLQEHEGRQILYRGDHYPVGYEPGKPLPKPVDQVEAENQDLKARLAALEARMAALAPAPVAAQPEAAKTSEAPRGAGKPK